MNGIFHCVCSVCAQIFNSISSSPTVILLHIEFTLESKSTVFPFYFLKYLINGKLTESSGTSPMCSADVPQLFYLMQVKRLGLRLPRFLHCPLYQGQKEDKWPSPKFQFTGEETKGPGGSEGFPRPQNQNQEAPGSV